jgi:hypothetical protein
MVIFNLESIFCKFGIRLALFLFVHIDNNEFNLTNGFVFDSSVRIGSCEKFIFEIEI